MREGRSRASCYAFSTREFFPAKKFTKGSQNFLPTTRRENHANFADHCRESISARPAPNFDCCFRFHRDSINKLIGTTVYSPPASLWQQRIGRNFGDGAR